MYKTIITFDDEHLEQTLTPNPQSKTENHFTVNGYVLHHTIIKKKKKKKICIYEYYVSCSNNQYAWNQKWYDDGMIAFTERWSPCSSRLAALQAHTSLLSHVILNEWLCLFIARFEYPPKWCTYSAVIVTWLVPRKLLPSRRVLCTPHNHAPCHVTSCVATHLRCMHVSCNLPPALLAQWPGSFMCCCGKTGWNGYRSCYKSRNWRQDFRAA